MSKRVLRLYVRHGTDTTKHVEYTILRTERGRSNWMSQCVWSGSVKMWLMWLALSLQQRYFSGFWQNRREVIHLALLLCNFILYEWHLMLNLFCLLSGKSEISQQSKSEESICQLQYIFCLKMN